MMKHITLMMISTLTVIIIMVCLLNKRDQETRLQQVMNYMRKSGVTQHVLIQDLRASNEWFIHTNLFEQKTSDVP